MLRRQKESRIPVAKALDPRVTVFLRWLRFRRELGASYKTPVIVQAERQHGLINFEGRLGELVRAVKESGLVAQRQRDRRVTGFSVSLEIEVLSVGVTDWARP